MVERTDVLKILLLRLGGAAHRERQNGGAQRCGLLEDRLAGGQLDGVAVTEAAYAPERPEVVVEGTVLLHQDHHMLDDSEPVTASGPRRMCRLGGHRGLQRRRQQRPRRRGAERTAAEREEPSP